MENLTLNQRTLVVGIDFGTTYSGVAYAISDLPDHITACVSWPTSRTAKDGKSQQKVPTTIRYLPQSGEFDWGFQIPSSAHPDEVSRWFKLGLQAYHDRPTDLRKLLAEQNTDTLVRDYLSGIGEHIFYFLGQNLGPAVVERYIERSALQFVLTVPAGTVDLITYTVTNLHPLLQVREAAKGSGDLCGGAFVDDAFKSHLQAILGNEDAFDNEVLGHAIDGFESGPKRQFSAASMPHGKFTVPVYGMPNDPEIGIRNGRLSLRASDIYSMFEPIVLQIIRLAKEQIHAANVPIDAVVLVGGFGTSVYLRERLKDEIEEKENIPIRFTNQSSLAVVNGAVMKEHYGVELGTVFDWDLHSDLYDTRYWDGMDGCWRVKTMAWFIQSGDRVAETKPYFHQFCQAFKVVQGRPEVITLAIYSDSDSDAAPLARNGNVKVLCHIQADLTQIATSHFRVKRGRDGLDYYEVHCDIEVVYKSASTDYTLIHDGVKYQTVSAEYV
ncbi:hypothetical protein PG987_008909 [Apiospora arundinis]